MISYGQVYTTRHRSGTIGRTAGLRLGHVLSGDCQVRVRRASAARRPRQRILGRMQPTPILRPRQCPSRLLIRFASLVLMVLVMATTSPAWAALARGEATVQDRADPAASATVVRPPVAPVIGVWQRRGAGRRVF